MSLSRFANDLVRPLFCMSSVRLLFEHDHRVSNFQGMIIRGLRAQAPIEVVEGDGQYDVKVLFCPIVSRAGTDIQAVLSRVRDGEVTIVIVLHHTFDSRAIIPSSSVHDREGVILVDFLFSEDQGLLECPKNSEAFDRTARYLRQLAPRSPAMGRKKIILLCTVGSLFLWLMRQDYHQGSCHTVVGVISGFIGGFFGGFNSGVNGRLYAALIGGLTGGCSGGVIGRLIV
ncbi:uncharacterized protein LOC118815778 isoform X2 [Colossoma macropomum]|uniref:uncharacterized protein LOC118815778 isoform X2 n=1 Tax=Colossoma macropomum TaxID=42526 RepID=UPI001864C91E|nr:uncharacterized protein LOC118815778 isoform X2 [Colossoma macropomum]